MTWRLETIGEAVAAELRRFGPAGAIGEIVSAWPDAVGPAIAENAWPARCGRDGTVTVTTSSSVWAFELTKLEGDVRARLAERLAGKAPPRLRFVVGRLPERGAEEGVPSSSGGVPEVTLEHRRAGEEIAAPVRNEELRALVARAAAASLARAAGEAGDRSLW
jgi:Dna[CI] antecedent, DciA